MCKYAQRRCRRGRVSFPFLLLVHCQSAVAQAAAPEEEVTEVDLLDDDDFFYMDEVTDPM